MKLPKYLTTVTPFSKFLAFILFITLPILFFYIGLNIGLGYNLKFMNFNENQQSNTGSVCQKGEICTPTPTAYPNLKPTPTPTCIPRPKCLDSNPRCMIAESSDMCPPSITPKACPNLAYKNSQGQTCTYSGPNCELICK